MKKIFTLLTACMLMLSAFAQSTKEYTESLVITINEISTEPVPATVSVVDNGDGTINFALQNFILVAGEDVMEIGNIAVDNLVVTEENGVKSFSFNGNITIAEGNDPNVEWLGPFLGEIPLTLEGKMNDEHLLVTIGIVMEDMGQVINVELGDSKNFEKKGKEYTEQLVITINEISTEPVPATVSVVDNGDGTINFALQNFILVAGEDVMEIGNIAVDNLVVTEEDGVKSFSFNGNITIAEGNDPNVEWLGPFLGEIPLTLEGKMNDEHLQVNIVIVMEELGQVINVELGDKSVFEPKTCEITFVVDDVTTTTTVKIGDAIVAPEEPTKEGYTFTGWYPAIPELATENATFVATWLENEPLDDAISSISAESNATYYNANGARVSAPVKGVNIVKFANGQVKKVCVK